MDRRDDLPSGGHLGHPSDTSSWRASSDSLPFPHNILLSQNDEYLNSTAPQPASYGFQSNPTDVEFAQHRPHIPFRKGSQSSSGNEHLALTPDITDATDVETEDSSWNAMSSIQWSGSTGQLTNDGRRARPTNLDQRVWTEVTRALLQALDDYGVHIASEGLGGMC